MDCETGRMKLGSRVGVNCLADPHQILCEGPHVLVTNTGRNCLTVVRREDLYYKHVWLDNIRWDRKGNGRNIGKHLNSVTVVGDKLYVLGHNFDRGTVIAEMTYPGLEVIRWIPTKASQAHNLWVQPNGDMLTCNTMDGTVMEAVSGRVLFRSSVPARMTRGLACHGKYVFVGMSMLAKRQDRGKTDGGVWILDRDTYKEIDFIPLPAAGNVREVRLVDLPDECHHGHVLKNVPAPIPALTAAFERRAGLRSARPEEPWTVRFGQADAGGDEVKVGDGPTLATCNAAVAADVAVTARVTEVAPGEHFAPGLSGMIGRWVHGKIYGKPPARDFPDVGLVVRYRGAGDMNMVCAVVKLVTPRPIVVINQNVGGVWKRLGLAHFDSVSSELRLEAVGARVSFYADGRRVLNVKTAVLDAGLAGVRTTTAGRFTGFKVEQIMGTQRVITFPTAALAPAARAA